MGGLLLGFLCSFLASTVVFSFFPSPFVSSSISFAGFSSFPPSLPSNTFCFLTSPAALASCSLLGFSGTPSVASGGSLSSNGSLLTNLTNSNLGFTLSFSGGATW
uniref:Putative secreted protein n=1 Tax=Ixodes ricinus TaxID=34613 RepID=A0A6B0UB03_IXORI